MAADAAESAPARRRGGWRWVWISTLVAFVVWHTLFDLSIYRGMNEYLERHARHAQGSGPPVTIHGVMDHAVRRGAWTGLAGAAVALSAAAALHRIARRRP